MTKIPTPIKYHIISGISDLIRVGLVAGVVAIAAATLFFHVSKQVKIIRLGYQIADVATEHSRLLEENKKLTLETSIHGRDEDSIKKVEETLDLHPPRPGQTRKIPNSLINSTFQAANTSLKKGT